MSVKPPRQCLNCGCYMTLKDWYPEMLCDDCRQDIDSTVVGNIEKGESDD